MTCPRVVLLDLGLAGGVLFVIDFTTHVAEKKASLLVGSQALYLLLKRSACYHSLIRYWCKVLSRLETDQSLNLFILIPEHVYSNDRICCVEMEALD